MKGLAGPKPPVTSKGAARKRVKSIGTERPSTAATSNPSSIADGFSPAWRRTSRRAGGGIPASAADRIRRGIGMSIRRAARITSPPS